MNLVMTDWAEEELDEAATYYSAQKPGLGTEFLAEFGAATQRIVDFPEAWGIIWKDVRLCQFKRFPYGIVYVVRGEFIHIVAIMHLHRRPGYWKKRLKMMDP